MGGSKHKNKMGLSASDFSSTAEQLKKQLLPALAVHFDFPLSTRADTQPSILTAIATLDAMAPWLLEHAEETYQQSQLVKGNLSMLATWLDNLPHTEKPANESNNNQPITREIIDETLSSLGVPFIEALETGSDVDTDSNSSAPASNNPLPASDTGTFSPTVDTCFLQKKVTSLADAFIKISEDLPDVISATPASSMLPDSTIAIMDTLPDNSSSEQKIFTMLKRRCFNAKALAKILKLVESMQTALHSQYNASSFCKNPELLSAIGQPLYAQGMLLMQLQILLEHPPHLKEKEDAKITVEDWLARLLLLLSIVEQYVEPPLTVVTHYKPEHARATTKSLVALREALHNACKQDKIFLAKATMEEAAYSFSDDTTSNQHILFLNSIQQAVIAKLPQFQKNYQDLCRKAHSNPANLKSELSDYYIQLQQQVNQFTYIALCLGDRQEIKIQAEISSIINYFKAPSSRLIINEAEQTTQHLIKTDQGYEINDNVPKEDRQLAQEYVKILNLSLAALVQLENLLDDLVKSNRDIRQPHHLIIQPHKYQSGLNDLCQLFALTQASALNVPKKKSRAKKMTTAEYQAQEQKRDARKKAVEASKAAKERKAEQEKIMEESLQYAEVEWSEDEETADEANKNSEPSCSRTTSSQQSNHSSSVQQKKPSKAERKAHKQQLRKEWKKRKEAEAEATQARIKLLEAIKKEQEEKRQQAAIEKARAEAKQKQEAAKKIDIKTNNTYTTGIKLTDLDPFSFFNAANNASEDEALCLHRQEEQLVNTFFNPSSSNADVREELKKNLPRALDHEPQANLYINTLANLSMADTKKNKK